MSNIEVVNHKKVLILNDISDVDSATILRREDNLVIVTILYNSNIVDEFSANVSDDEWTDLLQHEHVSCTINGTYHKNSKKVDLYADYKCIFETGKPRHIIFNSSQVLQ